MRLAAILAIVLLLVGCSGANRSTLPPNEATTTHVITMTMEKGAAFLAVEEAMALAWVSFKDVNQLRQPETGTLIMKGRFSYGDLTGARTSPVTARIKITAGKVTITYAIDEANDQGWAPSEDGVDQMWAKFAGMSRQVAGSVDGVLQPVPVLDRPTPEPTEHAVRGKQPAVGD